MNPLILDCETTIFQKGNPFSERNKLCLAGSFSERTTGIFKIEYDLSPYGEKLRALQKEIDKSDLLVGFNIKFDLHWLQRYGIKFKDKRIWDVQLAHFIMTRQLYPYPSLNDVCEYYGFEKKLDIVKEYWENGIDTPNIPLEILTEYLEQDLRLTYQCFEKQVDLLKDNEKQRKLINIHQQDLLVLQEMEWNGIKFDWNKMEERCDKLEREINDLENELREFIGDFPFNFDSGDHISCLLYGGTCNVKIAEPYEHVYKTGEKQGTTAIRNRWTTISKTYERLVEPIKGSELKKEGYFSTDEGILRQLKPKKEIKKLINLLLKRSELEKLKGTYYEGIPKLVKEMDWADDIVHGGLNQCVAVTGRLSATKPNQQNLAGEVHECIVTRF